MGEADCNDSSIDGVVRNKLITALRVYDHAWKQCVLKMKNLGQKYKKVKSMHDPYNYTRLRTRMEVVMVYMEQDKATCPFFPKVTFA